MPFTRMNWPQGSGGGGTPGKDGKNGATFTPHVSAEGVLSWTNDQGLPNPEPVNIKGPAGEGGGGTLEADLIVSNPMGKYTQGAKIDAGTSMETIMRGILSKTYYPTLSNPTASITYDVPALVAVGDEVAAGTARLNFNRGSINPKYTAESEFRAGPATKLNLKVDGSTITFNEDSTSGVFNVPAFTRHSKGKVTITGTVNYGAGVQPKDSDGNNYNSPLAAGSVGAIKQIEFVIPFLYGATTDPDNIDLSTLTQDISGKSNKSYHFATNQQYMVFAYDADHGALSSIKDPNNFETINAWTHKVIGDKIVYVITNATTDPNAVYTFIF